jgi:branched-chain amino acid transport system permease protein
LALEAFYADALVYGSLVALMSSGLTLVFITSKVPNFAHGVFVTIGVYTSYTLYRFWHLIPYAAVPVAFLLGGGSAMLIYRLVIKPIRRRNPPAITLMVATFAVSFFFIAVFGMYSDYLSNVYVFFDARLFSLISTDFTLFGIRGDLMVAPTVVIGVTVLLWLLLTKTEFGTAMRATIEIPALATTLGINTERVYLVSWMLSGGLAATAGVLLTMWLPANPQIGSDFLIAIFAASTLGGLNSIFGSIAGGLMTGAGQIVITIYLSRLFGRWLLAYEPAIPLLIMAAVLLFIPQGITSIDLGGIRRRFAKGGKQ